MSKSKKIISVILTLALVMTMAVVAIASTSALSADEIHVVAGVDGLCGSAWDPADTNNQMTWNADKGIFEKVYTNVAAGTYEFKVTTDYAWDKGEWNLTGDAMYGGANASVTVDVDGSTVIVGFDGTKALVEVVAGSIETQPTTVETQPTTVETQPTTVETQPTTVETQPAGDDATVYFSNGHNWEVVNIHYWGAEETEWPGVAMEFAFTNDYGQDVYKYTVPAGTTGIIFNDGNGTQTQDIKEGIVDNAGFYIDMDSTQNEQGHWGYGTWTYTPPVDDTQPTTVETQPTTVETQPTTVETQPTTVETQPTTVETQPTTVETQPTTVETQPTTTETQPVGTGVTVGGVKHDVAVGDEITYTYTLTTPVKIENIQATTYYDETKLELVVGTAREMFPVLREITSVVYNTDLAGEVKFNATEGVEEGFDFTAGATLVTLKFKVIDTAASEIVTVIEEMVAFQGDDLVTGSQIVATGVKGAETLTGATGGNTTEPTTVTEPTQGTTVTEPTQGTTVTEPTQGTTVTEPTQGTTVTEPTQGTTVTEPTAPTTPTTTEPTEPTESKPVVEPTATTTEPDATSATGTTPEGGNGTVGTGVATTIYVVLAVVLMAAAAAVVLRKRVNG